MLSIGAGITSAALNEPKGAGAPAFPALGIASVCADLDFTSLTSYPGSGQTLANLIAAPADGVAQAAYDFLLGSTSGAEGTDPVFTGSGQSARVVSDGTQFLTIKNGNTTLINGMHKNTNGAPWSICLVGKFAAKLANENGGTFFGSGGRDTAKNGIAAFNGQYSETDLDTLQSINAADGFPAAFASGTPGAAGYGILVWTLNPVTGAAKLYHRSSTPITGSMSFQNATTNNATDALNLLAAGAGTLPMKAGTELVAASIFNAVLSDANVTTLRSNYGTRHGRSY